MDSLLLLLFLLFCKFEDWYQFLFKYFVECISEAFWSWAFLLLLFTMMISKCSQTFCFKSDWIVFLEICPCKLLSLLAYNYL